MSQKVLNSLLDFLYQLILRFSFQIIPKFCILNKQPFKVFNTNKPNKVSYSCYYIFPRQMNFLARHYLSKIKVGLINQNKYSSILLLNPFIRFISTWQVSDSKLSLQASEAWLSLKALNLHLRRRRDRRLSNNAGPILLQCNA